MKFKVLKISKLKHKLKKIKYKWTRIKVASDISVALDIREQWIDAFICSKENNFLPRILSKMKQLIVKEE